MLQPSKELAPDAPYGVLEQVVDGVVARVNIPEDDDSVNRLVGIVSTAIERCGKASVKMLVNQVCAVYGAA
jgi:thiamine monophosphate synthase